MLALCTKYTCMYCFDPQTRIVACGYMDAYILYCILYVGSMSGLSVCVTCMLLRVQCVCVTLPGLVCVTLPGLVVVHVL